MRRELTEAEREESARRRKEKQQQYRQTYIERVGTERYQEILKKARDGYWQRKQQARVGEVHRRTSTLLADEDRHLGLLPEEQQFRDDGCEFSLKCVDCPLPRCKYEMYGTEVQKYHAAMVLYSIMKGTPGLSVAEMMERMGKSRRSIYRHLETLRELWRYWRDNNMKEWL